MSFIPTILRGGLSKVTTSCATKTVVKGGVKYTVEKVSSKKASELALKNFERSIKEETEAQLSTPKKPD